MLGLRHPTAGAVTVLGGSPQGAVSGGLVGAVLQSGSLPSGARVGEVVEIARRLYGCRRPHREVLELAGIDDLASRRVEWLSGGQSQRVRFAIALAGSPRILFLDEPSVGLDVEARRRFWASVQAEAQRGISVVFATHYLDEVDQHADRVIVIDRGRVIADGPPEKIKRDAATSVVGATLPGVEPADLAGLGAVIAVERTNDRYWLSTTDPDTTVADLYARG